MTVKALPKRFTGDWAKAECYRVYEYEIDPETDKPKLDEKKRKVKKLDEDGKPIILTETDVEYLIEPMTNRIRTHIASMSIDPETNEPDLAGAALDALAFSLKGLKGVIDPETNEPMVLEFKKCKVGRKTDIKRVSDDQIDRLPPKLFDEISRACGDASKLSDDEGENLNFT